MIENYKNLLKQIEENKDKKIIFWGASLFLERFLKANSLKEYNILGVVDKNENKKGSSVGSLKIYGVEEIENLNPDYVIFTIKNITEEEQKILNDEIKKIYPNLKLLPNVLVAKKEIEKSLQEIINFNHDLSTKQYNELLDAQIFNNLINSVSWIKSKDFIPTGGAATYTFLKNLFIILEYIQPKNILEFGMGQTSKLTAPYITYKQNKAKLTIVEQDKDWLDYFSKQLPKHKNINLVYKKITDAIINGTANTKYENLSKVTQDNKYDLIIIDGPIAGKDCYPRTNIIDLIPQNLAKDFIIILDDAERYGEQNTAELIFNKLEENNIEYCKSYKTSVKTQLVIASPSYRFIAFY